MRAVPRFGMKPGERLIPLREIHAEAGELLKQKEPWPEGAGDAPLLTVEHLSKSFSTRKRKLFGGRPGGEVLAVDDVSFEIKRGECLGLVGESGCGKTTTSKMIMRALTPSSGKLTFNDHGRLVDILSLTDDDLFRFRRKVQFIFQDPFSSLNPRMTVFDIISEPLNIHNVGDREERVRELMTLVGLDGRFLRRYPHSFSGGQRQRIGIARALALQPDLLICDEPVSALDVSVQAQVLNLLKDLQDQLGLTYLFISHNLAVVDYIADRIAVMCAGRLVETAPRSVLFSNPIHPYTRALLSAVPKADPNTKLDLTALMEGKASDPAAWPAPFTLDGQTAADMIDAGDGHFVRAHAGAALPREL
jgi:peptide/nickel transport system ATP-binding protein